MLYTAWVSEQKCVRGISNEQYNQAHNLTNIINLMKENPTWWETFIFSALLPLLQIYRNLLCSLIHPVVMGLSAPPSLSNLKNWQSWKSTLSSNFYSLLVQGKQILGYNQDYLSKNAALKNGRKKPCRLADNVKYSG